MKLSLILTGLIFFFGCSTTPNNSMGTISVNNLQFLVTTSEEHTLAQILKNELDYIETIPETGFKDELINTLKVIRKIDYLAQNCSRGQVACSNKMSPDTLFINHNFLELIPIEQFTAILHEARHLQSNNFDHVKCQKKPEWGYECDEDLNSPYGIEYKYLLHKYVHQSDDKNAQVLQRLFLRLNKI